MVQKKMEGCIEYFKNGKAKSKGFLKDDKKYGKWEFYYESGNIFKNENYENGQLHGKFKRWFENGKLAIEGEFNYGNPINIWVEYYETGNKKEEGFYQEGDYFVNNFWDEKNKQTLKNGSGYKIERYGALEMDVYKQYFENFKFFREEKLSSLMIRRNPSFPDKK